MGTYDEKGCEIPSKTECMYFAKPGFYDHSSHMIEPEQVPAGTLVIPGKKSESPAARYTRESAVYDKIPQTARKWIQGRGFIDLTKVFKYLGSLITFDLRDDQDIQRAVNKAYQAMGALKNVWDNQYIDMKTKYAFFMAIPVNLLLWGCETWAIKSNNLRILDVFVHRSIRRILKISIQQVQDERIRNSEVRKRFYNIPNAERMISIRQLNYLGKLCRNSNENFLPKQLLLAWINHKRPKRGVLFTNKRSLINSLNWILPPIPDKPDDNATNEDLRRWKKYVKERKAGHTKFWLDDAKDEPQWNWLIDSKIRRPHLNIPRPHRQSRQNNTPPQSPNPPSSPDTNRTPPCQRRRRAGNSQQAPPSPADNPMPSPPNRQNLESSNHRPYNPEGVGHSLVDSLACMGLEMSATEREVRIRFRQLSRIYHPDKHRINAETGMSDKTGLTNQQAQVKFQELNNAQAHLCLVL